MNSSFNCLTLSSMINLSIHLLLLKFNTYLKIIDYFYLNQLCVAFLKLSKFVFKNLNYFVRRFCYFIVIAQPIKLFLTKQLYIYYFLREHNYCQKLDSLDKVIMRIEYN